MQVTGSKVAIAGAGNVGSSLAFSLMIKGIAREIVLIDVDKKRAEGECMDLHHGASFVSPVKIYSAGYEACAGANVIVIAAGAKQKPGQSRMALLKENVEIFKGIVPEITKYAEDVILLIATNPVDILTYVSLKVSGLSSNKVIGSGTVLDSSRLRYLISEHCSLDPRNVHAYIIGEHGDTELAVWSHANVGGMLFAQYCPACDHQCDYKNELNSIFEQVKNSAYKIIEAKGATYYAIALALVRIIEAILRDENSVLPVSTLINDYYGVEGVCLSIPCVVNKSGAGRKLQLELSDTEQKQLKHSAKMLKETIKSLKL